MPEGIQEPIVIVTPFYDGTGGVAVAVRQLAIEFRARGHQVLVLARGDTATVTPDPNEDDLFRARLRVPYGSLWSLLAFCLVFPVTILSIHRFLSRRNAGLVLVQYGRPPHFYFGVLRHFSRRKLVVTFQGSDAHGITSCGFQDRLFFGILLRSADGVTAVADSLLKKVKAAIPGVSPHTAIIPNGAPTVLVPAAATDDAEDYCITVGLLIPRKGIDVLIRALGILKRRGITQRLLVVGDGPERAALEALAVSESVGKEVVFAGEKSHAEVLALLERSRFFVLASRAEGLPLVVVEAMMCGRPVVATNVDGIPDIVAHQHTGLLVDPEEESQLADAMQTMIEDDQLRRRMGCAARGVAKRFEWRHIANRYLEFFDALHKAG
jgi:glycosyltransferase involved in cell wall biosynthesis